MKHLKRFNESSDDISSQIEKFCDDNLAYLKDIGFEYDINWPHNSKIFNIVIQKEVVSGVLPWSEIESNNKKREFTWLDIKYDFIPFVELLNSSKVFEPYQFSFMEIDDKSYYYSQKIDYKLSDILDDVIDDNTIFIRLAVYIKLKEKSILKRFFGI